jgi:2-amino-4-hydroxy-6-hydroxymethyldihydropteridine diphosphokinase
MELLRYMPGISLVSVSRYRDTRPIGGPPGQGSFLNGACLLETDLAPHDVLGMLAAVENTLDRERGERWGPRTVDLDLLLYDDIVLDTESLTLPHPRMATRRFVLEPCVEIAPDLVHPVAACTLECLLESISSPHPHVAVVGVPGSGAAEVAAAIAHATLARLVSAPPEYAMVGSTVSRLDAFSGDLAWRHAVEACAKPLLAKRWSQDPHGTVADYWLDTVRLAAADSLAADPLARFESFFARMAAETVPPHVVILLIASPDVLEERIALRTRQTADRALGGGGRPLAPAGTSTSARYSGTAVCAAADDPVARLLRLQERMTTAILRPQAIDAMRPRAVVTIAAEDLGQAVQEAVAAVEAMA